MEDADKPMPLWAVNSLVFIVLFMVAVAYFLWQGTHFKRAFLAHAGQHAILVSEVIKLNARGTVVSQSSIENLLTDLLKNSARFVAFLDNLEPFAREELTVLARQNGLAGIKITRPGKQTVSGPESWLSKSNLLPCRTAPSMEHLPDQSLYILSWPDEEAKGCIQLGFNDTRIAAIKERLGLDNILKTIHAVPGIAYIKMEKNLESSLMESRSPAIKQYQGRRIAEARQKIGNNFLLVGVDAGYLATIMNRLRINFYLFSLCFAITGLGLSWFLHRYQAGNVVRVRQFERKIASQKEAASLGRSAAAIAHEIRNPLNSLGMGLQRLEIENQELTPEHKKLVDQMLQAVSRANASVTRLLHYATPGKPRLEPVCLHVLLEDILGLFFTRFKEQKIRMTQQVDFFDKIKTDPELLAQVFENIIRNAAQAQPYGGFFHYGITRDKTAVRLLFNNGGCTVPQKDALRILEPYFTTRTEGTGLGMTIVKKGIESLGGTIHLRVGNAKNLEIRISLPFESPQKEL